MNQVELEDAITEFAISCKEDGLSFAEIMKEIHNTYGDVYDKSRIAQIVRGL